MKEVVEFKSVPVFFEVERTGAKSNTMRKFDKDDERFKILRQWQLSQVFGKIRIKNSATLETFERQITNISAFHNWIIISWNSNEVDNG